MAHKFQIGDTVQVVKDTMFEDIPLNKDFTVGHRGQVADYESGGDFPYFVKRSNGNTEWFKVRELKLIKRKK